MIWLRGVGASTPPRGAQIRNHEGLRVVKEQRELSIYLTKSQSTQRELCIMGTLRTTHMFLAHEHITP